MLRNLITIFLIVVAFSATANPVIAQDEKREIVVGVLENWPPQYSINPQTNQPAGFAVDIMNEIAKLSGLEVKYKVFREWPALNKALKEKKIDVIPSMGITEERKSFLNYTTPTETTNILVFVRDTATNINTIDDLIGRPVSVVDTNIGRRLMEKKGWEKLKVYQSLEEALMSMISGNSDGFIYPDPPMWTILSEYDLENRVKTIGEPLLEIKRAIAVRNDNAPLLEKLDSSVKKLLSSKKYSAIYRKWFKPPAPYWTAKRVAIVMAVLLLGVAIILSFWRYVSIVKLNKKLLANERDLKNALDDLKVKQNLLDLSQKIAHIGSWHLDIKKNILSWSDENYRVFGRSKETFERTYEAFLDTVHPDDREMVDQTYTNSIKNSLPYECIHRVVRDDGEIRVVHEKSEDITNEQGETIHSFGFTQDITERVQNEERFQQVIGSSIDGFWIADTKANLIEVNDAYCKMSGYDRDELLQMSIKDIEAIQTEAEILNNIQSIVKLGSGRFDSVHRKKDGSQMDVDVSIVYSPSRQGQFFVFIRDNSERNKTLKALAENEERFRLHFQNLPIPYQSLDFNGYFLDVNPAWLQVLGYEREEVIGKSFGDFLLPEMKEHCKYNFPRFKDKGEILGVEFEMVKKDGSVIMVRFNGRIGYDSDGNFKQTHCVFQDITDIRKVEEEKQTLKTSLQQAQKMEAIGTLAGGIAHDFNNILGVILGYAEIAKDDAPADSKLAEDLDKVLTAGNRAKELVKQILAFSRQEEVNRIPLQLQSLVKEVVKMLRASIPTTIEIQDDIDSKCGPVLADPTHVHQILMNLCTNANHAMEESGGVLKIELKQTEIVNGSLQKKTLLALGHYVELVVSDSGTGINSTIIDKIFDPYFTTKELGKGTGMGLAIIHGIIGEYGGAITVESEVGQGTRFHVYFPIAEESEVETVEEVDEIPTGKGTILFVDDEDFLAEMGKDMLERLGYEVTVKTSSIDALRIFQDNPNAFDVIITDQTMPGMTGADLSRRILQIRPDIPIILCTGYSTLIDEPSAKSIGIREFALKPLTKGAMAKLLHKVLHT